MPFEAHSPGPVWVPDSGAILWLSWIASLVLTVINSFGHWIQHHRWTFIGNRVDKKLFHFFGDFFLNFPGLTVRFRRNSCFHGGYTVRKMQESPFTKRDQVELRDQEWHGAWSCEPIDSIFKLQASCEFRKGLSEWCHATLILGQPSGNFIISSELMRCMSERYLCW